MNQNSHHSFTDRRRHPVPFPLAVFALTFLFLAVSVPIAAQPNLNIKRVTVNWPTIELYFSVGCNGNPAYDMQKQNFHIFENGIEVNDFTLWCPNPTVRCAISVALVFDASGSMVGSGNAGAKQAGHAFVDLMDGVVDEASMIWFNNTVTVYQQMTTVKPMLHSAVDALPASGSTAVWDGIYTGISELVTLGMNPCRSVIVMTDGVDNASTHTVAEIISFANRNKIRVFTIGLGTSINATELQQIAILTGGLYYQTPNAGQLAVIVTEIYQRIAVTQGSECVITYERPCADGALRTIEMQLQDYCGGADAKTKTYRAPLDSTTYSSLRMKIGNVFAVRGSDVTVPLNLVTPLNNEALYPFSFTVLYDTTYLKWQGVNAPAGSLLAGASVTATPALNGTRIAVNDKRAVVGSGKLLDLHFTSASPPEEVCTGVHAVDSWISQGCHIPQIDSGRVCLVIPEGEAWYCDVIVPKIQVDTAAEAYDPMPFQVFAKMVNIGAFPVDSVTAEISFPGALSFAPPDQAGSEIKPLTPSVVAPGGVGGVSWTLQHPVTLLPRDYYVTVRMVTPSDTSTCQEILHIPAMVLESFAFTLVADGPLSICEGDSVTLDAGPGYAAHFWNTGDTTRTLTVKTGGNYFCSVLAVDGRPGTSDTVRVIVHPALHSRIAVDGSIPMCEGDTVTLDAGAGVTSYLWNTGDTTQSIRVYLPGDYWAEVRYGSVCPGYTDTVTVTTKPSPAKPLITRAGDVLMSPTAVSYEWYRDGAVMPGEVNQFLVLLREGRYRVRVTNEYGCSAMSDEFDVLVLDAGAVPAAVRSFDVYPDPTRGAITIELRLAHADPVRVLVLNSIGQEIARYESGHPVQDYTRQIELGNVPGAYYLHITAGRDSWVRRVVRVR